MTVRRTAPLLLVAFTACRAAGPSPAPPSASSCACGEPAPSASASNPSAVPRDDAAELAFVVRGQPLRRMTKTALREAIAPETVSVSDNYYDGKRKTWRALPMKRLLAIGFAGHDAALETESFVLRCVDGYTVPMTGKRLLEDGGYVAIADADVPDWEPVGHRRDNPGPYFIVWTGKDQQDLESHPRPYQLAAVEIATFESTFPRVIPTGEPKEAGAWRGLALYRDQCIHCHAINQQGGKVGPELNVPRSVTEYRPEAQLRAFIRNPRDFRYSAMPAHPHLRDEDLDGLIAYLRAMSLRKQDPNAKKPRSAATGTTKP